ncbi:MAG: glycoside hydrolase family 3 protein [Spirochaetaceae bacterium]|jgi:beta-N-acetylhexosaminidase|nr:glycoside hydrolase family 3 protein [Spirochaetaceae bacterium]
MDGNPILKPAAPVKAAVQSKSYEPRSGTPIIQAQGIVGARSVLCAERKGWSDSGTPKSPVAAERRCAQIRRIAGTGKVLKVIALCSLILTPVNGFALNFFDGGDAEKLAEELVGAMSDEDALAQTFMLGWRDISGGNPSNLILEWIEKRHIGAVKVFGWNTADTPQLARNIGLFQRLAARNPYSAPLLVATDQEGGLVRHVKGDTTDTPGAMAIGASGFPEDAYKSGYYIGRELSALGINMNFAPTVDLYTNHSSVLIGPRSFGDYPEYAGIMGIAFARGLLEAGVIPTAKHFPGHGDTELDSHGVLPSIDAPFDVLWDRELVPYRMMAKERIPAVMSGHIAFPNTESAGAPASLSKWFLDEVLRNRIGFEGLVITDDMIMNGATMSTGSLSLAVKQALLAGNDIIMMSSTPAFYDPVWVNLLEAMRTEDVFNARVRDAARRVLTVKLKYLRGEKAVPLIPDMERLPTAIPDKEGAVFFQSLAARSVTLIKDDGNLIPLNAEKAGRLFLAGQNLDFFALGKKYFNDVSSYWYSFPVSDDLMRRVRLADTIIFYLSNREGIEVLRSLRPLGKKIIVLSVLSPAYLSEVPWVDAAIAVYGNSADSLLAGFSVILGKIPAQGAVPFVLNSR